MNEHYSDRANSWKGSGHQMSPEVLKTASGLSMLGGLFAAGVLGQYGAGAALAAAAVGLLTLSFIEGKRYPHFAEQR